jgi:hypothetical protein
MPPLPESTPPRNPPLPSSSQSPNLVVTTNVLQETVEGVTRNLTSEDVVATNVGVIGQNVAAMRGGAPATESAGQEGLQVGLLSLEMKS